MIEYRTGNLLEAETEALVNTVNTQGVMGKGIALQFKERFRHNFKLYSEACKRGDLAPGILLVVTEHLTDGDKIIINFPTKVEWFRKSQYHYITEGLDALVEVLQKHGIKSVALPPLGCGNGGLNWLKVKPMIEKHLGSLPVTVVVYEPNESVKALLQKEERKKPQSGKESTLTPARAMLLQALWHQVELGEDASVFAANKLAYFLQEEGENLKLKFIPHHYGPYDQAVEKVLYKLNGEFLTGLEQMNAQPFEPLLLITERREELQEYIQATLKPEQKERLNHLYELISGFESTLSLEVLSSVHYVRKENRKLTSSQVHEKIASWNERKARIVKPEYVQVAVEQLERYEKANGRLF